MAKITLKERALMWTQRQELKKITIHLPPDDRKAYEEAFKVKEEWFKQYGIDFKEAARLEDAFLKMVQITYKNKDKLKKLGMKVK